MSGDATLDATVGLARAEELYERIFVEYGDDSVAQLGGVHLACEQASNVLSKVLEWGHLMAYLEQSTRYIAYNQRLANGQYRYYRPPEILDSPHGARCMGEMDRVFDTYGELLPRLQAWVAGTFPAAGGRQRLHLTATRAKSLDALRGLLPGTSLSNIGMYGTGQSYEQLLLRMRAHPLPEARSYADLMLVELRKVIPSFLQRVDVADRGGESTAYLAATQRDAARLVERLSADLDPTAAARADLGTDSGRRGDALGLRPRRRGEGSRRGLLRPPRGFRARGGPARGPASATTTASLCSAPTSATAGTGGTVAAAPSNGLTTASSSSPTTARTTISNATACSRWSGSGSASGSATTCPASWPRPGWGSATTKRSGGPRTSTALFRAEHPEHASYAVALAHRIRYVMQLTAARPYIHRAALQDQGHPAYRRVAQEMHRAIAEVAGHRALAEAMAFVDHGPTDLERLEPERRAERRRAEKTAVR